MNINPDFSSNDEIPPSADDRNGSKAWQSYIAEKLIEPMQDKAFPRRI